MLCRASTQMHVSDRYTQLRGKMANLEYFETLRESAVGWFPVLTLIGGYLLKSLSDLLEHRRIRAREREAREASRRDQREERRTTFQRQILLDLQEAVNDLARATGAANVQDVRAYRLTGEWQEQPLSEELSENFRLASRRTAILKSRVLDDLVRELVQRFKDSCGAAAFSASREAADSTLNVMASVFEELNERIGLLLRQMDDDEAQRQ